jgi:hypothetical protein
MPQHGKEYIVVPDDTPTEMAPHPQPGDKPKYIPLSVLIDAGMRFDDSGEARVFLKPDGTPIAQGELYILPARQA